MKKTTLFKKMILDEKILECPVAHDPMCAKIIEKVGFSAVGSGGLACDAIRMGVPDTGLLTLTEMVDCACRICDATDIPVLADGDAGHGNVTNLIRTVQEFEKAGVAALMIEDQDEPTRCGHTEGKKLVTPGEMAAKLSAALETRKDPDLMILARCDAIAVSGMDDGIERGKLYRKAGADIIFFDAIESIEQMKRITSEIGGPAAVSMVPGGLTPVLSAEDLQALGFNLVVYPTFCTCLIAKTVTAGMEKIYKDRTLAGMENDVMGLMDYNEMVRLSKIRESEERFESIGRDLAMVKIETS
jgi:2-methylisocitrate lyase-like PEP mutase family enzyme